MKQDFSPGEKVLAAGQHVKERDYWLEKLSGDWVKGAFPYDRGLPGTEETERNSHEFALSGQLSAALWRMAGESNYRLFMILLTALYGLLYKYTDSPDMITGAPIYKQEAEGDFINTVLALRCVFEVNTSFKELLLQVRQVVSEAVEHQDYPIEALISKLDLPASGQGFPLFDTVLLLENIQDNNYLKNINVGMIFSFARQGEQIRAVLDFDNALYEKTSAARICGHLSCLLEGAAAAVNTALGGIDILSTEEKKQLLFDFNGPVESGPEKRTIVSLFEAQAAETPHRIAAVGYSLEFAGPGSGFEENSRRCALSYGELNKRSNRLAHLLRRRGIKPGAAAAVLMDAYIERLIVILGIIKAGGAYLPIDTEYPGERVNAILNGSGAAIVLTDSHSAATYSFTDLQGLRTDAATAQPYRTTPRSQVRDFDALPLPDRSLVDYRKYSDYIGHAAVKKTVSIQGTRGCPYKCAYCHKIWPKTHICRSAKNLFAEIEHLYKLGARRFAFVDDIFNLNAKNSRRFFELMVKKGLAKDVQLFFPNGLRGDILTLDYIDLMVEAGTVSIAFALETGSPRLQKLLGKNLDLDKLRRNFEYIAAKHPRVLLEIFTMIGFPSETEEEAQMTLEFIKSIRWFHFPYVFVLKVYPNTDMARLAATHGVSEAAIRRSVDLAYHELPETLPFPKTFVTRYQGRFMAEYFLLKERLLQVLPHQVRLCTEEELAQKYDNFLPMEIKSLADILNYAGISPGELENAAPLREEDTPVAGFHRTSPQAKRLTPPVEARHDAMRILLLDMSHFFSRDKEAMVHSHVIEPLGLMYLLTYLDEAFGPRIQGKIYKSSIDFDSYDELKTLILEFQPHLIGIRSLSYYRLFFHRTVSLVRQWGIDTPIVSGGPYASSDYELVLQDRSVDVVVLGEGEITFAELVEKMLANDKKLPGPDVLQNIPGIAFLKEKDKLPAARYTREVLAWEGFSGAWPRYSEENPEPLNTCGNLLYMISTSGSTGRPKNVLIEHRTLANLLHFQYSRTNIDFCVPVLQFASIGFDVSAQEIFSALCAGGTLYPVDNDMKADVPRLLALVERHNMAVLFLPPAFLKFLFSEPAFRKRFPRCVSHIISAGEQLKVTAPMREYLRANRVYLHNHYGPSETHVVTALTMDPGGGIPELPSIGSPISNTAIYILDKQMKPKPIGAVGKLYIAGANVGRGYLDDSQLTTERFIKGAAHPPSENKADQSLPITSHHSPDTLYRTGDLARWLANGTIEFIGRADLQVKIRGFRIELEEIEKFLLDVPFIKEAVVIDREDSAGDRYLCAYVVSQQEDACTGLRDILSRHLPEYMMPQYFVQLDKIPLTANGKLDRRKLPAPEAGSGKAYVPPGDAVEKKFTQIWSEVLGVDKNRIGIDDNFFELGGNSLKATIMVTKIHREFSARIALSDIFKAPTIREVAGVVARSSETRFTDLENVEKREFYVLSSNQRRLWIIHRLEHEDASYNMSGTAWFSHPVEEELLKEAIRLIMQRHEGFRTCFKMVGEDPVQFIADEVDIPFESVDIAALPQVEKSRAAQRIFSQEMNTPFDLSRAPLVRFVLVKQQEEEFVLLLNMHHIITDGWSMGILKEEFLQVYESLRRGQEPDLSPLKFQYKDFAHRENKQLRERGVKEEAFRFWKRKLETVPAGFRLPRDFREESGVKTGASYYCFIPGQVKDSLKRLAAEHNTGLFAVLLALFYILLTRLTDREQVAAASPVLGRDHDSLHRIVGFFVNTVILPYRMDREALFSDFLARVKEEVTAVLQHQAYPLEAVLDDLGMQFPHIDVFFNMYNIDAGTLEQELDSLESYHEGSGDEVKFNLVLYITEYKNGIEMNCNYRTALFKPATAASIMEKYKKISEFFAKNPGSRIREYKGAAKKRSLKRN